MPERKMKLIILDGKLCAFSVIVALISYVETFEIIKHFVSPRNPSIVGSNVELTCQTDSKYEYCDWWNGEYREEKECKFEWKRRHDEVRQQRCDILQHRMMFDGNFETHECKGVLSTVRLCEAGTWTCKIEEYAFFGRGDVKRKIIQLEILSGNNTHN